jgi:hypothetical protein
MRNHAGRQTGVSLGRWRLPDLQPGLIQWFLFAEVGATFCIGLKKHHGGPSTSPRRFPSSVCSYPFWSEHAVQPLCIGDQQVFSGELTFAFPGAERLNQSPVYVCSKFLGWMSCGYTEIVIPPTNLERLKRREAWTRAIHRVRRPLTGEVGARTRPASAWPDFLTFLVIQGRSRRKVRPDS